MLTVLPQLRGGAGACCLPHGFLCFGEQERTQDKLRKVLCESGKARCVLLRRFVHKREHAFVYEDNSLSKKTSC
jgi:hypothetical protein